MALSSSEHDLLVETCTNMNVAANTCREVLEMLRSLGNTGVVDIATHNNSQGAHAGDATIFHIAKTTDNGKSQEIRLGSADGLPFEPFISIQGPITNVHVTRSYTNGRTAVIGTGAYEEHYRFLSDANRDRIDFSDVSLNYEFNMYNSISFLVDSDGQDVRAGLLYYAGKLGNFAGNGVPPYSCIRPIVTNGDYSSYSFVLEINGDGVVPDKNNVVSLGNSTNAWKDAFLVNAPTVTSDRRLKKDISALGSQAVDFIKALRPVSYRLKQGEGQADQFNDDGLVPNDTPDREGVRTHWGLIAQEVREALSSAGYEDAALWCLTNRDDPDSQQSLRYEELIAPMIKVIQNQQERIEALERKVA